MIRSNLRRFASSVIQFCKRNCVAKRGIKSTLLATKMTWTSTLLTAAFHAKMSVTGLVWIKSLNSSSHVPGTSVISISLTTCRALIVKNSFLNVYQWGLSVKYFAKRGRLIKLDERASLRLHAIIDKLVAALAYVSKSGWVLNFVR